MTITINIKRFKAIAAPFSFGMIEQILFSGSNFLLNIVLVRILQPEMYGAYVVMASVLLFVATVSSSLVLEPMLVIGQVYYKDKIVQYQRAVVLLQVLIALSIVIILSFFFVFIRIITHSTDISFSGLLFAIPFILLYYTLRFFCYTSGRTDIAFRVTALYTVAMFLGLFVAWFFTVISAVTVFLILGVSSGSISIVFFHFLKINFSFTFFSQNKKFIGDVAKRHWTYGRWILGSNTFSWISNYAYALVLAASVGLGASGIYRALENLVLPIEQLLTLTGNFMIPQISRERSRGRSYVYSMTFRIACVLVSCVLLYGSALVLFGDRFISLLYGAKFYQPYLWLVPFLIGASAVRALSDVGLNIPLRIYERTDLLLIVSAAGALVTVTVGFLFVKNFGLLGAGSAKVLVVGIQLLVSGWLLRKLKTVN